MGGWWCPFGSDRLDPANRQHGFSGYVHRIQKMPGGIDLGEMRPISGLESGVHTVIYELITILMTINEFNVVIINFQLSSEPSICPTLATYDTVARLTAHFS